MNYKVLFVGLFFLQYLFLCNFSVGKELNNNQDNTDDEGKITIKPDSPVVTMLDSLANLKIYKNLESNSSQTPHPARRFPRNFVPEYSDSIYKERFEQLNNYSPINFEYNSSVKTFIDLYGKHRRDLTERIIGLSKLYFPYFEEQLDKHNLPLELKYIAVIESALNPVARSHMGATGPWQFMYGTGRMYGLEVNSYVDYRSDIIKSTIAACEHFSDLYNIYEDWLLVMAAYNAGAGNVNRAIRRAGGIKDFWSIRGFLPRETSNYVPAFMGVAYIMEYSDYHNLYSSPPPYTELDIDTIHITQHISLRNISEIIDIPLDHLRYLNPSFRKNIVPASPDNYYVIRIPKEYSGLFVSNEEEIYNYKTPAEIRKEEIAAQRKETTTHIVRRGEVLGTIAQRYGCSVRQIQRWNNLRGTVIRPGQRLIVRAPQPVRTNLSTNNNVHVVRKGETLDFIASRYNITTNNLIMWNGLQGTTIFPGQHIIIKPPEGLAEYQSQSQSVKKEKKAKEKDSETKEELQSFILYQVQKGDTLNDIVEKHPGVTINQIREKNNLDGSTLKPGQKLKINVDKQQN